MTRLSYYQRKRLNSSPWFDPRSLQTFQAVIEREVLFTIGRSKVAPQLDAAWRRAVAAMTRHEVLRTISKTFDAWPARRIVR